MKQRDTTSPTVEATARALGLSDPASRDTTGPTARVAQQAAEDIAAGLLLIAAPAPVAPPRGTLAEVQRRILQGEKRRHWVAQVRELAHWAGWGVAAVLALWMGLGQQGLVPVPPAPKVAVAESARSTALRGVEPASPPASHAAAATAAEVEKQVGRLQSEVAQLRQELQLQKQAKRPMQGRSLSVIQIGKNAENSSPEASRALVSLLTSSLRPYLAGSAARSIGPELVIERGFGAFTADSLPENFYYRHLAFPKDSWEELGLYQAADGSFYDPEGGLIWQEDPLQSGSYLGLRPVPGQDLSRYQRILVPNVAGAGAPTEEVASVEVEAPPAPIAIVDPATDKGMLLLPSLPKPASVVPDAVPHIWAVRRDATTGKADYELLGMASVASVRDPRLSAPRPDPVIVTPGDDVMFTSWDDLPLGTLLLDGSGASQKMLSDLTQGQVDLGLTWQLPGAGSQPQGGVIGITGSTPAP